jgi:AsmA protein
MPVNFESMTTNGTLLLKNVDVKFNNINTVLDGNLKFSTESDNISISKADLQINGLPAALKGKVQNLKKSPYLDISLSLPKSNASDLQNAIRSFASLEGLNLSGNLSADIKLKGKPEKLESMKANGNIKLDKVGVTYEDLKALLNGSVKFTDKLISINIKSTVGRNTAELTGTVSSFFKNQKININLYSKKLFIDELIPDGKQKGTPSSKQAKSSKPASQKTTREAKQLNLKMTANGEIRVDSAEYNGLTMSSFLMSYQFKNNKLNISKLTGKAGKGRFNLKSSLDLSKPGYKYNLSGNVDSLYAEEIINAFFPKAKDTVFGVIKSDLKLHGAGTLTENIRKNLVADGNFNIQDGKVTNIGIADNLSMLFNLSELKSINFHQANGTVMIRNGIAKLNSVFNSDDLEMNPGGDIGLDGNLDLAFDLKLSPRLTGKAVSSSISKYMTDQRGWGTIPLICPGTMSKPSCGPDLAKTGKQIIEKKINKVFDKLFNKEQKEPPTTQEREEQQPSPEEQIKDIFKQLF